MRLRKDLCIMNILVTGTPAKYKRENCKTIADFTIKVKFLPQLVIIVKRASLWLIINIVAFKRIKQYLHSNLKQVRKPKT